MDKTSPQDIRSFLQNELVARCGRNPKYSLRAFAKSLGIYHATLSALLAGRRPFTQKSIRNICEALDLSPQMTAQFTTKTEADPFKELTIDTFMATSEWYYDAILELTHTKQFRPDPKWIGRTLGITVGEVNIAVERLERLELMKVQKNKWIDLSRDSTTIVHNDFTSAALRKYQEKILELSMRSLHNIEKQKRDHTSVTLAIQLRDLENVKQKIRDFRRDLTAYLQRPGVNADSVYQMAISFFPLSEER